MEGHAERKSDVGPPRTNDPEFFDETNSTSTEEERLERAVIRKIDLHILPVVVLLYLFSFLDRGS